MAAAALARRATWVDRNGSRFHASPIKSGVASAAAEDRPAPTHPNRLRSVEMMPLVEPPARFVRARGPTGFEKVGEWMDPSCTVWARMEFAEPIPLTRHLARGLG